MNYRAPAIILAACVTLITACTRTTSTAVIAYASRPDASADDYADFLMTQCRIIESLLLRKRVFDAAGTTNEVSVSTKVNTNDRTIAVIASGGGASSYLDYLIRQYILFRAEAELDPVIVTFRPWRDGISNGEPIRMEDRDSELFERTAITNQAFLSEIIQVTIDGRLMEMPNNRLEGTGDPQAARQSPQP